MSRNAVNNVGFILYEHHPDSELLTKEVVRGWVRYETLRGRSGMAGKASVVRKLAEYMGNGAYILPYKAVPKCPRSVPYILTDDELSRLFVSADNIKGGTDRSTKLMFPTLLRLLYTCGLRPNEVRLIKRDNINFLTGEIFIERSKRHKERIVVMSDDMLEQCRKFDIIRAATNLQSEYFFVQSNDVHLSSR